MKHLVHGFDFLGCIYLDHLFDLPVCFRKIYFLERYNEYFLGYDSWFLID